jgi:dTDP-4-dehydrorhamnose 3,5-epimerase
MRFAATPIDGAFIVDLDMHADARGSFGRIFCGDDFRAAGIAFRVAQANLSRNAARHTLRGLHSQSPPHEEAKLVQCARGALFDVAVDLRPHSPTRGAVAAVELDAARDRLFYIPEGCAHGFLTLAPETDLVYYMGRAFVAGAGIGVRWDDPAFAIPWPARPEVISDRDAGYPDVAGFAA